MLWIFRADVLPFILETNELHLFHYYLSPVTPNGKRKEFLSDPLSLSCTKCFLFQFLTFGLILILKPNPTKRPTVQPSKRPTQQPSSPRPTVSVFILIATIFAFLSICVLSFTKSSNIFTRLQTKQPTRQPTNPTELPSMQPTSPNVRSHKLVLSHIVCIDLMHMSHVMIVTTIIPI